MYGKLFNREAALAARNYSFIFQPLSLPGESSKATEAAKNFAMIAKIQCSNSALFLFFASSREIISPADLNSAQYLPLLLQSG